MLARFGMANWFVKALSKVTGDKYCTLPWVTEGPLKIANGLAAVAAKRC